jgi:Beta-propeller repeat/Abnormal spindle-like microcephaly-assoc'd, ASPM-SPD-2-Hydin
MTTSQSSQSRKKAIRTLASFILIVGSLMLHPSKLSAANNPRHAGDSNRSQAEIEQTKVSTTFQKLPLRFEANLGQTDPHVNFLSRGNNQTLFLTPNEAVLALRRPSEQLRPATGARLTSLFPPFSPAPPLYLRMSWVGANSAAQVAGEEEMPAKVNYLIGNQQASWRTQIPLFSKVRYRDLYPGIDILYYGNDGNLEYDLIVSPGADPKKVRLHFRGAKQIRLDPRGDLVLRLGSQFVILHKPVVYQQDAAFIGASPEKHYIDATYVATTNHEFTLRLAAYDHSRPLIIDPALTYSSYLGGSNSDSGGHVAVDSAGNAYIVGVTDSADFPVLNALQPARKGSRSIFVAKINPQLPGPSSLVYSTYFGGSGSDVGRGITVDSLGNVYIVGDTNSTDFPLTSGAFQPSCKGPCIRNAFVAKIDPSGKALLYSSYLGGSSFDMAFGVALDPAASRIYLTGSTTSSDFPTTAGALQTIYAGGSSTYGDAYLAVVNPAGNGASDLNYSTYLGGSNQELGWALAVDTLGYVYVTGSTMSTNFPVTPSAFQSALGGVGNITIGDGFLAKINPAGLGSSDLMYSTYFGGITDDRGESVAVDPLGFAYVVGWTTSANFPVTPTAYQPTYSGGTCNANQCADAILMKWDLRASGASSLLYSTFLGGTGFDLGHGIALDSNGIVYVAGETDSNDFPLVGPIQTTCGGGCPFPVPDVFVSKLDITKSGSAALLFSTYLGGSGTDTGESIAIDSSGNAYVTGQVFSSNFPTVMPFQSICNNCTSNSDDSYLAKICITACPSSSVSPPSVAFATQTVGSTSTPQPVTLSNPGAGTLTIISITTSAGFLQTNSCGATLSANSNCTINVSFNPQAAGPVRGSLTVATNAAPTATTVALSGSGVIVTLTPSPTALTYAALQVGATSSSQPVTLTNPGSTAISITSIQASGDFAQTNNCGASLAANSSCTVDATFTPTASGTRNGTVTITDNASNSPQAVSLTGTGTAPVISLSTSALTFSAQVLGTTSAAQSVTVSNTGNASASISSITAGGDFAQANNCGTALAATTSCIVNVTFTPTATGTRSGTLTITDNAAGSPQTVSLTGTGGSVVLNVSPGALTFPAQALASASASQPVTVSNPGAISVSISGIQASGDFGQTNNCGANLAAGANCTANVTFTPTASGPRTGTLTITDTASNSPQSVSLSGSGVTPTLSLSTTSIYFGTTVVGTSSSANTVTLSNTGSVPVTILSIQTTTTDYQQTNNCGTSLNAGSSCVVNIVFRPTTFNARPGSLVITDNAAGSPQNVSFTGTGTIAQMSGGWSVTFGNTAVGTTAMQSFTITDVGTVPLNVGTISIGGSNAADFSQTNNCAATIAPKGFCTVTVTFTPSATGPRITFMTIPEDGGGVAFGLRLSGNGVTATGVLNPSPAALTFNSLPVGSTSSSQPLTLTNPGSGAISVTSIQASGDFAQTNTCGSSVAANSSCMVSVTFTPTASGTRNGTLTITDSASNSPQTVSLAGTGTAPVIAVSTAALTFSAQVLGSTSASQPVTVSNTGNAVASLSSITATGDFAQTSNCGTTLAASTSCTVNVTFIPTATGTRTGSLSIVDNAAGSPQAVSLSGTGANSVLNPSPLALAYAAQLVGSTSNPQPVTLTNPGSTAISVTSIQPSGDFAQANTCGSSVAANSTCTINVTFTPTASGTRNGTLTITDSASNSSQTISLTGTGTAPVITVSTTALTFSTQVLGSTSAPQSVTVSNTGNAAASLSSITAGGDFAQTNNCGTSLAPSASCTVNVTFTPTASGTRTAALTITDNDPGSPQTVLLTGTGGSVVLNVSTGTLTFPAQALASASTSQPVTLSNPGLTPISISGIVASGDFGQTNNCGASLAAASSCTVSVTFTPTASGTRTGTLTITDTASNSPQSVSLSGSGVTPTLTLSASSFYFGTVVVGTSSSARSVTLSNTGSVPVTFTSIQTTSSDYQQTNTCGTSLNVGSSCAVNIVFQPTTFNARSGSLLITDNAAGSPQNVPFTGTGTIALMSGGWSVTFGSTTVGTSLVQSFTITDVGTVPLNVGSISLSGSNAADFSQINNCAATIAPAGFCTVTVTFTPSATGARFASMLIPEDGGGVAFGLRLSGTGN